VAIFERPLPSVHGRALGEAVDLLLFTKGAVSKGFSPASAGPGLPVSARNA
jgi:hypothetical protein